MLAAFLETFVWIAGIFFLLEIVIRLLDTNKTLDEDQLEQAYQALEDAIVLCRVEQIDNVFYFYNSQDDTFIGQATDISEMNEVSERLQKHLMVVEGDDDVVTNLKIITGREWQLN